MIEVMALGVDRRIRRFALLGVLLHTLFVTAAPFEHHDLICHLKTPQHCTSCTSSPVGSSAEALSTPGAAVLRDAGSTAAFDPISESALLAVSNSGRSPPASA
jgi:hypothetical protein